MPLIQGGPPQWIWERPKEQLKWELNKLDKDGRTDFELRLNCGLEIVQLQFFSGKEIEELRSVLAEVNRQQA
jgi:hypothetical protein